MTKPTILVIDDDPTITQLFNALLSEAGCSVLTASNGENGLTLMRSEPIDLVLTDFMMPSLNGLEFARAVGTQTGWSDTKIVFISVNDQPEYRARAPELGAIDYLPKSLGAETIVRRVVEHLAPSQPSSDTHDSQLTSLTHLTYRLDRIELLADHFLDLIAIMGGRDDTSDSPGPALQTLGDTGLKIRETARGTESSGNGSSARAGTSDRDRLPV